MSDRELLERCARAIGALLVAVETFGGAAPKRDLLDGARALLGEVDAAISGGTGPAANGATLDEEGGSHG